MKSLTRTRPSVSSFAQILLVFAALTLALGASAQRHRPSKKGRSSASADKRSRGGKSGGRAEQHEAKKRNAPKRKPAAKKSKKKAVETPAEPEAPGNDTAAAATALQNRRTLEDDKHLTRTAVIVRLGELAKAGWRKAGEDEEAATKRAATLAETAKRLEKMEGDRHLKTLARFQVWSAALEKGEAVPALAPAEDAKEAAEEAPQTDAAEAKPKSKRPTVKSKKRAEKAKPRARGDRRGRGGAKKSGSRGRRR